jgi:hypothetical protein
MEEFIVGMAFLVLCWFIDKDEQKAAKDANDKAQALLNPPRRDRASDR